MNLTGLNSNRYLAHNRIPITITGDYNRDSEIVMSITRNSDSYNLPEIRLFPSPSGLVLDLSPYIKGLLPIPYVPGNSYSDPIPNTESFNITFSDSQDSEVFLNKTFIRGGRRTSSMDAQTVSTNTRLAPVDILPYWDGYPNGDFKIDSSSRIRYNLLVDNFKQMRNPKSCDPFYIRFLNSLGGYSFWMFNSYESDSDSNGLGTITGLKNRSLGFTNTTSINADTRVKREFYPLMLDLMVSPVVERYKDGEWNQIFIKPGTFNSNNYEDLAEVTCEFETNLNYNPGVIW